MADAELPKQIGKYEVVRRLACGGMAEVLLARAGGADGFSREVVIKRVLPQHHDNSAFLSMFRDEARITAQLFHGNIVQVIEFGEQDGQYFLVLEYVNGPSLASALESLKRTERRLSIAEIAHVMIEIARALDYAHRKRGADGATLLVVHRDVSPSNVLLSLEGEVKLVDFGIARARARLTPTTAGVLKGKLAYMAPETLEGRVEPRSDLFGLGATAYEMLTGTPVFSGSTEGEIVYRVLSAEIPRVSTLRDDVPDVLDGITARLLERDPADRPSRALEVVEALMPLARVDTIPASEILTETLASLELQAHRERSASLTGERQRVLVVDQSRTMRALVRLWLGDGFRVLEASSGDEAMELLGRDTVAAVVCQSVLPGQTGIDLCRKLRSRSSLEKVPFVLLAADVRPELEQKAEEAGAQAVVPKQIAAETLRATIEKLTGS